MTIKFDGVQVSPNLQEQKDYYDQLNLLEYEDFSTGQKAHIDCKIIQY